MNFSGVFFMSNFQSSFTILENKFQIVSITLLWHLWFVFWWPPTINGFRVFCNSFSLFNDLTIFDLFEVSTHSTNMQKKKKKYSGSEA